MWDLPVRDWNTPSIDGAGSRYVALGRPLGPGSDSDAILGLPEDGAMRALQRRPRHLLTGAQQRKVSMRQDSVFLDVDFGAGTILANRSGGRDIVLAGQKSSTLWALDPDREGKVLWSRNFGPGSIAGGIHWGIAYDGQRVFAPVSVLPGPDGKPGPGEVAVCKQWTSIPVRSSGRRTQDRAAATGPRRKVCAAIGLSARQR